MKRRYMIRKLYKTSIIMRNGYIIKRKYIWRKNI